MEPKILIPLGDAWVDPKHVIAVDTSFDDEDPGWPNIKVTLSTGHVIYGMRTPLKVVRAIRHPELDDYDEETERETDGTSRGESAADRARRRYGAEAPEHTGPRPLRREE